MYSSRRKSKRSYRKRVVSRKNKTRSRRKNLKFRKMRGGAMTYEEFKQKRDDLGKSIQYGSMDGYDTTKEEKELNELFKDNPEHVDKLRKDGDTERAESKRINNELDNEALETNIQQEEERRKARESLGVSSIGLSQDANSANWQ